MITTLIAIVNTLTETGVNDYSANFKITDKAHVHVYYVDDLEPEVELVQVESFTAGAPNEYKVNAITESGFNVELRDTYAAADDRKISTRRIVPFTQEVEYPPGNDFPGSTHERALDKLTAIIQQFSETIARQIGMPLSEDAETMTLPNFISNYYLGLDGDNNLIWKVGTVAVGNDEIKDSHIDWGTGVNQVSAEDMPIEDAATLYTASEVEAALAEVKLQSDTHKAADGKDHSDVVLNNTHKVSDGSDHTFIDQDVRSSAGPTFIDGKKLLTSSNYVHDNDSTYNEVFDIFAPLITETGESLLLVGIIRPIVSGELVIINRAYRASSTTIELYGYNTSSGTMAIITVTDGDATTTRISASW